MSQKRTEKKPITANEIDWSKARHIGDGSWGVVFAVRAGVVAKVSLTLSKGEVETQQYLYQNHHKALPVLGYEEAILLPSHIQTFCCPIHGQVKDMVSDECACERVLDVLFMPRAQRNIQDHTTAREIKWFMSDVTEICREELNRWWDEAERNVAWWNNHLVALDFDDPDND